MAKKLLSKCQTIQHHDAIPSRCHALRKYGKYLANSYTENVKIVIENYFTKSLTIADGLARNKDTILSKTKMSPEDYDKCLRKNKIKAYQAIAEYSDREYNQLIAYMKSDNFVKKKINVSKNEESIKSNLKNLKSQTRDEQSSFTIMSKNTSIDKNEIQNSETECRQYLQNALENYVQTCSLQNELNSSLIFRIISLWLGNNSIPEINAMMKDKIQTIASYKFLIVLPQISARIDSTKNDDFTESIKTLLGTI